MFSIQEGQGVVLLSLSRKDDGCDADLQAESRGRNGKDWVQGGVSSRNGKSIVSLSATFRILTPLSPASALTPRLSLATLPIVSMVVCRRRCAVREAGR